MINPFNNFLRNILNCFSKRNLRWHLLAMFLTAVFVLTGFDWFYFRSTRSLFLHSLLFPAVKIGGRLPIIAPIALYGFGKIGKRMKPVIISYALGQAVIIGLLISSFYKAFTGRVHPLRSFSPNSIDISREFRFGFLRGGMFWGWPSSHTTIAFSMAVTLLMLYPASKILRATALLYALYIGIGVSISIHWFSDCVADAIIGTVIGVVVGTTFRDYLHRGAPHDAKP